MGRPEILTDEMKAYIFKLKRNNQELKASELTEELKRYLVNKAEASKQYPGMTREEVDKLVEDEQLSRTAITRFLTEVNHNLKTPSELDKPWSVSTLIKYPISPEALPLVLSAWVYVQAEGIDDLSIREAQWIGRLYRTANTDNMDNEEIARWLSIIALQYSDDERFAEMTGLPYFPGRSWSDLVLYEEMIGQEVSPEIREKIEKPIAITPKIEKAIAKYKGKGEAKNERLNKTTNK